jgi:hypothetical protein
MTALYLPEDELRLVVAPHLSRPAFAREQLTRPRMLRGVR